MKKKKLFVLILFTIIISACTKNNSADSIDIAEYQWRLRSIATSSGFSSQVPDIPWRERNDRYLLTFNRESNTVGMYLIANRWVAHYSILGQDSICLRGSTTTEVGYAGNEIWVEDTINAYGSALYRFQVNNEKLVMNSDSIALVFSFEK